ncbi:chorismate-binding protein [Costertonia aggregata]|uniref:Chorismate-binding protein n=1 Tax=Costertonia aggregata TaxID=343403 RepID=A0A7H9AUP6_9FLAO|nr:chorismate-binding protein [Costertonia aggregata]QLG47164.1 chorismate-binding protein [Costertonia aggregata]
MFSDFLKKIEEQYHNNLPFVVYRKPEDNEVKAVFQHNDHTHKVVDYAETGFVLSPFESSDAAILIYPDETYSSTYRVNVEEKTLKLKNTPYSDKDEEFHIQLIKKGIQAIKKGDFKKVVLSRVLQTTYKAPPVTIFQRLLNNYSAAFCYLWYHPKIGLWLGATPETLIKIENDTLTTNSLAGTQLFTGDLNPHWGQKEKEEQQLVTDYIVEAISGAVSAIQISDVRCIKAGNLMHLKTKVTSKIVSGKLNEIISKIHPTPAVCGMPKRPSKAFILKNENYHREYYTGFLGELNMKKERNRTVGKNTEHKAYRFLKKTTELYVNLRCMQLKDNAAHIYVGGGITKDSIPEKEWEETVNKSRTMLDIIT